MCGATCSMRINPAGAEGLSPRVRGNPFQMPSFAGSSGPIPACAGQPHAACHPTAPHWAYPRVCGATGGLVCMGAGGLGLSPRVRGNLNSPLRSVFCGGPIPACAGQPAMPLASRSITRAYPRVCGATVPWALPLLFLRGLSPRVRGNRNSRNELIRYPRPIPACAGQPLKDCLFNHRFGAYPRVCGATESREARRFAAGGLSPRVRGNRIVG